MAFSFNPITGQLDLVGSSSGGASPDNFSYLSVADGETVEIPEGQQMLYDGSIVVDGTLDVSGEISEIVNYSDWSFGWNTIPADVSLYVQSFRDFLFSGTLTVEGSLTLDGNLIEVS